ncbi:MAG: DUF2500 family protein [Kofleriaceae bacterium]|nr:DUF2500 family protein [Kofleriaceae bacterium]MCB9574480.1 DUF2500 family protein [Kofleriaceae bacterium]
MICLQCGATISRGDGRFCSHCGTALPDRPRIAEDEWATHPERFDAASASPEHASAMQRPAPAPALGTTVVAPAVFLVFWCVIGVVIIGGFAAAGGAMALFPVLLVGAGVVLVGKQIRTNLAKARAPVVRLTAVIIDERTEITTRGSGDDRSTSTHYYATLQLRDGTRREMPTTGPLAGVITRGDIGVAVTRGGDLVDFHRVQV